MSEMGGAARRMLGRSFRRAGQGRASETGSPKGYGYVSIEILPSVRRNTLGPMYLCQLRAAEIDAWGGLR
jgi:hypothetical protein